MHKNINQLKMGTLLSYVTIAIQNISAIIYTPLMLHFLGKMNTDFINWAA